MIERNGGQITVHCDGPKCHEFFEAESREFSEALAEARSAGWVSRKEGGEWCHYCEECKL